MKTKIVFLLTMACINFSYSQTYYPLVDTNKKVWKCISIVPNSPPIYENFRITTIVSDSLVSINSKTYKRYYKYGRQHFIQSGNSGWFDNTVQEFFLREDSSKKVYKINDVTDCGLDTLFEYVLYDFSLNMSDTFKFIDVYGYCYSMQPLFDFWKVINVDSAMIVNSYRKRITLKEIGYNHTVSWIEGVGSSTTPMNYPVFPYYGDTIDGQLACFYLNNINFFKNPDLYIHPSTMAYLADSCLTPLGVFHLQVDNSQIYISDKVLYVNTTSAQKGIICLYNILGKCVLMQQVQGNTQIDLQSKGINDELLFYRMTDEKRILKTGKLYL